MERFIKEYANTKIKEINANKLMQIGYKKQTIEKINKALNLRSNYLITIDEAIKVILEAWNMKQTNFTVVYNTKTKKYDIIRFNAVYSSLTEQELKQKGFIIKNNKLYDLKG